MAFKLVVLLCAVAAANAGYLGAPAALSYGAPALSYGAPALSYGAPALSYGSPYASVHSPALVSQQSNILRSPGNLGQVSTYSKTINTPYSSVSKSDVRVSNDALIAAHAPVASYAAPVATYGAHAPIATYAAGPAIAHAAPAGLLGVAYSAAPVVSHMTYSNGLGLSYAW